MPDLHVADIDYVAAAIPFETWYATLQSAFANVHQPTSETRQFVTNRENLDLPIHRWYNLKESFAATLPTWVVTWMKERYKHSVQRICDPFLGSATSGVALASTPNVCLSGVEYNPFIRFVAATKATVSTLCAQHLQESIGVLERIDVTRQTYHVPMLTTLHNTDYSPQDNIQYLLGILNHIRDLPVEENIKHALRIGVAATIDDAVHLHKDGRALRYRPKSMDVPIACRLEGRWHKILDDVRQWQARFGRRQSPLYEVYSGSATNLWELQTMEGTAAAFQDNTFDTIIYSPPYLNNFDYSEIYKLELWMLGFVESYEAWQALRRGTLRSHPAVSFTETQHLEQDLRTQHIAEILRTMGDSNCLPNKERVRIRRALLGYFEDMYQVLNEQWRVLEPGGMLAYVVANSRHYYLPIATDVIIGEIARCIGFEPLDLAILRQRNGRTRQKTYLRESIAFFRKPNNET